MLEHTDDPRMPGWICSGKLVALLTIALCAIGHPQLTRADNAAPRPNVVFILADDLGFSDLGCYGGEIATPNLDGLADNGLRFTQFYNTARCWPSRAALLTGYYAQQVRRDTLPGVPSGGRGQRPAWAPLLPAMLKPLGYRSYHSGKWHIDGKILPSGFDRSYSLEDHNRFFKPKHHTKDDQPLPAVEGDDYYAATAIADHALECLEDHAANHRGEPFFAYVAFTSPHFPLQAPQVDIDRYRRRYLEGWNAVQAERGKRLQELGIVQHMPPAMEREVGPPYDFPKDIEKLGAGETNRPLPWDELTDQQRAFQAEKMAIHAAMVDRMDQEIGRILAKLKQMDAFENTLIMFASDNGASAEIMVRGDGHDLDAAPGSGETFLCLGPGWSSAANTPFRRHKTWVHEGGISTPLIAHWPRGISAHGELRRAPAHLIDIVPTVLELAGGAQPKQWHGVSVPTPPGKSLVAEFSSEGGIEHDSLWWLHEGNRALRSGDWKIVAAGRDSPWELYNLAEDRGEMNDLASKMPEKVSEMARLWQRQFAATRELATADLDEKSSK